MSILIGSPLDSIIFEVFMDKLESEFSNPSTLSSHISIAFWRRYVDDVLCLWTGLTDKVSQFHQFISGLYPSIDFAV